ncbi:autotransporter assembly complex protein TamA [Legionella clemsonensis]|uniref:Translocation and assembly module subunit TamA n=1 Tax=Legionella clemsonensis TaxID=1867846 RepID=A0A222P0I3_9GAMM|nr:BamA/TamA family outer membrane protein [Legionella clemsonensis]ASQ45349.1 Translocation and assembly module TamA precursor [Legionella clemsonensis]
MNRYELKTTSTDNRLGFVTLCLKLHKQYLRFFVAVASVVLLVAATSPTIKITGVKKKIATNIEARLTELAKDKPLNNLSDEELRLQIIKAMEPYGYFKPQVTLLGYQPLRIAIVPGEQVLISDINIEIKGEGTTNSMIKRVLEPLSLKQGDALNTIKYEELKQNLLNAAEHQGFMRAAYEKSEILIHPDSTASIDLILNTGPQFYFGQVRFDPTFISPELLKRYIPFQYGQPYSTDQILAFNNQLAFSGYFKNVSIKPQIDSLRHIPVDVHLEPAERFSYSLGLGYGTDTGLRGRLGYHVVPLNPAGHKFNAAALGSFKENALQAQYIIPGTNPITDQYTITANLAHLDYNSGASNSVLTSIAQQHTAARFQRTLALNGLYERYTYTNQPREEKNTLFPKASFTWLKTKDKLFSPSGYNITLTGLGASKAVLSEVNFAQASINVKAALTLDPIRTRLYFHSIQGITEINDINQMPLSLAFLLGGSDNLKGYSYNSLGPGKILTYNGIEIQKETADHWYFVVFFDSGDVYMPISKIWKNDAGVGLMWVSPVGPIKIGVAQPMDNHFNRNDQKPRLVINMGPDL